MHVPHLRAYASLSSAMIIVGSSVAAGALLTQALPVYAASLLRFGLASLVIVPLVLHLEGGLPRLSTRSWGVLALQALFGSFGFTVLLLYGLRFSSPAAAGVVTSTTPACMALLAWLAFGERPSRRAWVGIGLAVGGVLTLRLLDTDPNSTMSAHSLLGFGLLLGAVLVESLFLLLRKAVREPVSPLAATAAVTVFGFGWSLLPGLWELGAVNTSAMGPDVLLALGYYVLFITIGAYFLWFDGVVRVSAVTAGVFTGIMPLAAVASSALVLNEPLHAGHLAGCALVVTGIVCIARK